MVHLDGGSLILAGQVFADFRVNVGARIGKDGNREAQTAYLSPLDRAHQAASMDSITNKRKETNINSGVV